MQLTIFYILIVIFLWTGKLKAQIQSSVYNSGDNADTNSSENSKTIYEKPAWKKIDIDILSSYYQQDGNNGAVTGGIGTEYLTDFTQKIIVNTNLTENLKLSIDGGYDYYSSVSTDNINNIRSSDSSSDMRVHGNVGLSMTLPDNRIIGGRLGYSQEYDYTSIQAGINLSKGFNNGNSVLSLNAQAFIDDWLIIYPTELRGNGRLVNTDKRQSYNVAMQLEQVVNKKTQLAIMLEATFMNGLLSTPFHRVYFEKQNVAEIEKLPNQRLKIPIGLRLNSFLSEKVILRTYYRFYWDDWGMKAHTGSVEIPLKLNRFFWVSPHVRYHTQNQIDYFRPYKEHDKSQEYYTSDYDLSALTSFSYGMLISYNPINPISKIKIPFSKKNQLKITSVELKLSKYNRSTEFNAEIISLGLKLSI